LFACPEPACGEFIEPVKWAGFDSTFGATSDGFGDLSEDLGLVFEEPEFL
jgi:hypothetical protein